MPKQKSSKRANSVHKWTTEECKKILEFMQKNPFEQPNGVEYYKNMKCKLDINLDYNVVRCKVARMVRKYKFSKNLLDANKDYPMTEVLKTCPYYMEFHEIFKNKRIVRRNTIARIPDLSPCPAITDQHENMATDIDETSSECSSNSIRFMVQIPTLSQASASPLQVLQPIMVKNEIDATDGKVFSSRNIQPPRTPRSEAEIPQLEIPQPEIPRPAIPQPEIPQIQLGRLSNGSNGENSAIEQPEDVQTPMEVTSTAPTSIEIERLEEPRIVADPTITVQQANQLSEHDIRLMELRLREKELNLRHYEVESNERLVRMQLESKERIAMKKLELKYTTN